MLPILVRIEFFCFTEFKKVTIVTGFMAKYVTGIDWVDVQVFSAATIGRLVHCITHREVELKAFDYVIFYVGTIDVNDQLSFENFISNFGN